MLGIERANKWYEIIERLNAIYYRQGTPLGKKLLVAHYLVFATYMWIACYVRAFRIK